MACQRAILANRSATAFGASALHPIDLIVRRAWNGGKLLFLVGPGGAGKSTLGRSLAPKLWRRLVDLDETFSNRIGDI